MLSDLSSKRRRSHCWSAFAAALLIAIASGGAARAETRAVVVGLVFKGQISTTMQAMMLKRVEDGLVAAGLQVVPQDELRRALGQRTARCLEATCWKEVATKLGCRYVVGGRVDREEKDYAMALWMGDVLTGTVGPWVQERCDICGLEEATEKIDLTASKLAAAMAAAARAPARVAVTSDPPGANVFVDDAEVGPTPRELELSAGRHRIVLRAPNYLAATRTLTTTAGVPVRLELKLVPAASGSPERVAGWVTMGAGVAALGVGIALLAINGKVVDCPADVGATACRRETVAEGAVLVGVGAAALGVGGYLLYRGHRKSRTSGELAAALSHLRFSF